MVIPRPPRYRDSFQAHYTKLPEMVELMVSRLQPENADTIWEPAGGQGELVDGVLRAAPHAEVWVSEIDPLALTFLRAKYSSFPNVRVNDEDAIEVRVGSLLLRRRRFQKVIANPPFGAWQTYERRRILKRRFPKLYVRDSYAVFLFHCFDQLELGGRLVFILPDTFLWLHRHEYLRRTLLQESTIEEIVLFPSRLFPNISFGYSGMSILTLRKEQPISGSAIRIIDRVSQPSTLRELAGSNSASGDMNISFVLQEQVLGRLHAEFLLSRTSHTVPLLVQSSYKTLGMVAEIRTGFYSGNDHQWVRRAGPDVPRSKGYDDVDFSQVMILSPGVSPPLEGIPGDRYYVPLLRGGAAPFRKKTRWYVNWSVCAVREYRRPGKNPARFQNSSFYFREGIGVPMVASGHVTAALLEHRLFDQGIVGVFPHDTEFFYFILGFLNSRVATSLVRAINPTANNSARYLARIPFVEPKGSQLQEADELVRKALAETTEVGCVSAVTLAALDEIYAAVWSVGESRSPRSRGWANQPPSL